VVIAREIYTVAKAIRYPIRAVARTGIDEDRAWRFLPVVLNDLTLIGGWNPRLLIG
jgi:hypothetical protein